MHPRFRCTTELRDLPLDVKVTDLGSEASGEGRGVKSVDLSHSALPF